jgi:two-component system cell cycle response regulator DivK
MPPLILIADDDLDNREIGKEILEANDLEVLIATNGVEALELARSRKPAVILMDLSMPKLDGWQATKMLKADPETKDIVIIAYTAHASRADEAKALAGQCDDYVSKPCPPKVLLAKISDWLERIRQRKTA